MLRSIIASISSHFTQPRRYAVGMLVVLMVFSFAAYSRTATADSPRERGQRIFMIQDGATQQGILTRSTTLRDALRQAQIRLEKEDLTSLSLDQPLDSGTYDVTITRARPVIVRDGQNTTKLLTPYRDAKRIADAAGIVLYDEDRATIDRSRSAVTDIAAEVMTIIRAPERTVVERHEIAFGTEKSNDDTLPIGQKTVKNPGVVGERTITYKVSIKDGKEVNRRMIETKVTKEPVKQVEVVGTKNNYSGSLNEWLAALRGCETGGTYSRNSGNGYYGAYQFLPSTWDSIARRTGRTDLVGIRPDLANPVDQDAMVIANTNATAGLSTQHPGCYKKLGLSNKPPA